MDARTLLEIAAEFVEKKRAMTAAAGYGVDRPDDTEEVARRWDEALEQYVADMVRRAAS